MSYKNFKIPESIRIFNQQASDRLEEIDAFLSNIEDEKLQDLFVGCIARLADWSEATLFSDFAPLSLTFSSSFLHGGLIFHGPVDGYGSGSAPTFSVTLSKTHGWSLHT